MPAPAEGVPYAVELHGITKRFPGVVANRDIELRVTRGEVHAIVGGIGMVHQHFMLADNFTVLENIVLGSEPTRGGRLDRAEARRRIKEISDRYALNLDPDELVEDLGVGARQRVEIAKVLYRDA